MTEHQGSLFSAERPPVLQGVEAAPAGQADRVDMYDVPLATRMRPRSLDEFVGQHAAIGVGSVLRRALDQGALPSLILWGPPGSGKTTLARLLAGGTGASFEAVSAVGGSVADLRAAASRAVERRRAGGRTVLFIDEIHRFNRAQQDAVLPHVENGVVRLLGATTENPGFEVNGALLSRARVVRLEPLTHEDLEALVDRALVDRERGLGALEAALDPASRRLLVQASGGDARILLDTLEVAVRATAAGPDGVRRVPPAAVEGALQSAITRSDRRGDLHFDLASALIKSIRGSDPHAAVYWMARLLEAGEDPVFVARRLVISAAEDVGLADTAALGVAVAAQQAAHLIGMPEARLPLAEAALYLALAPKSNSAYRAYSAATALLRARPDLPVPLHLRNAPDRVSREHGHGRGYRSGHDHPEGVVDQVHLPDELVGAVIYTPGTRGSEVELVGGLQERVRRARAAAGEGEPPI